MENYKEPKMGFATVNNRVLQAALLASGSIFGFRYELSGVIFDDGNIVTTDGPRLFKAPISQSGDVAVISSGDLKLLFDKCQYLDIDLDYDDEFTICFNFDSNEFTIGIEEDYGLFHGEMMNIAPVQWRNVIDVNKDPENIQFGLFNADYIKDACEISRIFANGRSANFHFIPSGLKTGAHIAFDYFDAEMIIMPIKRGHYGD